MCCLSLSFSIQIVIIICQVQDRFEYAHVSVYDRWRCPWQLLATKAEVKQRQRLSHFAEAKVKFVWCAYVFKDDVGQTVELAFFPHTSLELTETLIALGNTTKAGLSLVHTSSG